VLKQIFDVASDVMKYPADAKYNPWGYVQLHGWDQIAVLTGVTVMFPPKFRSEEERNRTMFEQNFLGSITSDHSWEFTWESSNNRVMCEPVPHITEKADYVFPDTAPWNIFPLGIGRNGQEVSWDVSTYPHCLIAGTTGSGKSVTQGTILLHALQSPEWRIVLIDPKRVELTVYRNHPHVLKVATELEDSLELIEQLEREMLKRYDVMEKEGINHFRELKEAPPPILLMVDETFQLLAPTGIKSDEGKAQDEMKARIGILLSSIARLGRASGIHQVLATQRPDAKVLPGELKANLDARIAQGRMDTIPSQMTLDSDAATKLPAVKGRAIYRAGQDTHEFQAYFVDTSVNPHHLKQLVEMSGHLATRPEDELREFFENLRSNSSMPAAPKKPSIRERWRKLLRVDARKAKREAKKRNKQKSKRQKKHEKNERRVRNLPRKAGEDAQRNRNNEFAYGRSTTQTRSTPTQSRTDHEAEQSPPPVGNTESDVPVTTLPDPELLGMTSPESATATDTDIQDLGEDDGVEYWYPTGGETLTPAEAQAAAFGLTVEQVRARSAALGRDITVAELTRDLVNEQATAPEQPAVSDTVDDIDGDEDMEVPGVSTAEISDDTTPNSPITDGDEEVEEPQEAPVFTAHLGAPWMPRTVTPVKADNSPFAKE